LDKRQDILGRLSNFQDKLQGSQPEEAAHREEEQAAAPAAVHPFISVNRRFSLQTRSTGSPLATASPLARQAAARHEKKSQREE
jgi:hypothetical protein